MKFILYFFLLYFAFQFIFRVVVPLFLAGRQLRKGFKQMKEQMDNQFRGQQNPTDPSPTDSTTRNWTKPSSNKPSKEDYLEFEEVKEE
jgi:hypothetical protein